MPHMPTLWPQPVERDVRMGLTGAGVLGGGAAGALGRVLPTAGHAHAVNAVNQARGLGRALVGVTGLLPAGREREALGGGQRVRSDP